MAGRIASLFHVLIRQSAFQSFFARISQTGLSTLAPFGCPTYAYSNMPYFLWAAFICFPHQAGDNLRIRSIVGIRCKRPVSSIAWPFATTDWPICRSIANIAFGFFSVGPSTVFMTLFFAGCLGLFIRFPRYFCRLQRNCGRPTTWCTRPQSTLKFLMLKVSYSFSFCLFVVCLCFCMSFCLCIASITKFAAIDIAETLPIPV